MSKTRTIIISHLLGGLLAMHASAAIQINFETAADLADNFTISINTAGSGESSIPAVYDATSGLGGSGGILVAEDAYDQFAILNTSFALVPGTTYSVSAYIRSNGYVGIGFADAASYASIDFQPTNSIMLSLNDETSMNVSNYTDGLQEWNNNDVLPNTITPVPDIQPGDWMALNLSMTYNGVNSFDLSYSIGISNESGTILNNALSGSYNVTNTGLGGNLYPFIFFQGDSSRVGTNVADNFQASAVPEPSTAMAAMIGLTLGAVAIRRRQRSC